MTAGRAPASAYAHFSDPLFIAGLALLALIGVVLRRPHVLSASVWPSSPPAARSRSPLCSLAS
ncbi:MAG TPA: hypothetical protein VI300_30755 [Solirubrobacter sp.]